MGKGIVVEEMKKYVVIMTSTGEFVKVKKEHHHYFLGQEISYTIQRKTLMPYRKPFLKVALATVMIFSLFISYSFYQQNLDKAFAYVAIDINPSLTIEINEKLKVVQIEPFNSDGQVILHSLKNWKNQDLQAVTKMIFDYSKQEGYLKNEAEILISIAFLFEETKEQNQLLKKEIDKQLIDLSKEAEISINTFEISKDVHEHAKKEKTTPNKYAIVQSAHDEGIQITIDEINQKSVTQINNELGSINILANGHKQRLENERDKIQTPSSTDQNDRKAEKQQNKPQEKNENGKQPSHANDKSKNKPLNEEKKESSNKEKIEQDKQKPKPNQENANKPETKKESKKSPNNNSNKPNPNASNSQKESGKEKGNSKNEAKGKQESN